jgi:uncharacterized protein YukE
MSDFKVIETQEQLDAIIGERIKRERETIGKKYEGFLSQDDYKAKESEFNTKIGDLTKQLKEANDKIADNDKKMAEKDSKIKAYESHSVKSRIAHEMGLSYDAVDFLKGDDEESIKKSAESLKALVGSNNLAPLASTETALEGARDAALKNTLKGLKGE